jgi:hypothetical protein
VKRFVIGNECLPGHTHPPRKQGKRPTRDQLKKLELDEGTVEIDKSLIRAQQAVDDLPGH